MRIKIPFTRSNCDIPQLVFGWVTMFILLCLPFISKPFISAITFVREKLEGLFQKKN